MGHRFSALTRWTKTARDLKSTQITGDPRIPQELVHEILDHLADDTVTLRSCSLVARSWTHPSYRHIFNNVFFSAEGITKWTKSFPNPE
jgi:hypothetical protein